jgi:hypothetical protein
LEAISGRHIRLPDPPYVFAQRWEFQKNSTDSSRLFKPPSNWKMLAWMKPYQQRNLALGRGEGPVDFRLRRQKEIYEITQSRFCFVCRYRNCSLAGMLGPEQGSRRCQ